MVKTEELTNPRSCMSRAQDHEWTFVLLARDAAAPVALRALGMALPRMERNHFFALADYLTSRAEAERHKRFYGDGERLK